MNSGKNAEASKNATTHPSKEPDSSESERGDTPADSPHSDDEHPTDGGRKTNHLNSTPGSKTPADLQDEPPHTMTLRRHMDGKASNRRARWNAALDLLKQARERKTAQSGEKRKVREGSEESDDSDDQEESDAKKGEEASNDDESPARRAAVLKQARQRKTSNGATERLGKRKKVNHESEEGSGSDDERESVAKKGKRSQALKKRKEETKVAKGKAAERRHA